VTREAARRARESIEHLGRSGAVSRRELLSSAAASAAVLAALASCTNEAARSQGTTPGGTFDLPGVTTAPSSTARTTTIASTPPASVTTIAPEAASTVLDPLGAPVVMDVQLHFLDPDRNRDGIGAGFPQASCGEPDPALCFSQDRFLDLVFGQSETRFGVLSGLPLAGADAPLALEVMERARVRLAELDPGKRLLIQAPVFPATGAIEAVLEGMQRDVETYPVAAWKTYTHAPDAYRLDDDRGNAMLSQAVALGRPIVAVHKGLSGGNPAAAPNDIGPAAKAHPDATIVVYHSAFDTASNREGPYDAAVPPGRQQGVDRLVATLAEHGIGPAGNVYAELGSTWFNLARDLDAAAHVLGKLLVALGPERILWGTDSIWYGSPQGQIDAFRTFQITPEFQERFGYPALTDEVKSLILGGNAMRLHAVRPER